eukprot:11158506-Lingulodinium_polyedra.AAC.1
MRPFGFRWASPVPAASPPRPSPDGPFANPLLQSTAARLLEFSACPPSAGPGPAASLHRLGPQGP